MAAPALRTQPVDRRRLTMKERQSYRPNQRLTAIAKAKRFKENYSTRAQRKPFATEQKPGTGGFVRGISLQQDRIRIEGDKTRRAESFRPENAVSRDIYKELAT